MVAVELAIYVGCKNPSGKGGLSPVLLSSLKFLISPKIDALSPPCDTLKIHYNIIN